MISPLIKLAGNFVAQKAGEALVGAAANIAVDAFKSAVGKNAQSADKNASTAQAYYQLDGPKSAAEKPANSALDDGSFEKK